MTDRLNMMVHCGGIEVDRQAVYAEPDALTATHRPISHGALLDLVESEVGELGYEVVNEAHALAREGAQYFGMLQLQARADADYGTIVGLRNSHDMSLTAGLAVGSGVFVCDNLVFSGEITISRKHTLAIGADLPRQVLEAVGKIAAVQEYQRTRIEGYKGWQLPERYGDALIVEMYRRGIINVQRIAKVVDEWDKPSHDEFLEGGRTAWTLFNCATEALKPSGATNLLALPDKGVRLHTLMDELCEIPAQQVA